jgi:hypothetical protein
LYFEGHSSNNTAIQWHFDLHIANRGRTRRQLTHLLISQKVPTGLRGWDSTNSINDAWLDPDETRTLRFTNQDLDDAEIKEPFKIVVGVSPGREFEITGKLLDDGGVMAMPIKLVEAYYKAAGISDSDVKKFEVTNLD